MAALSSIASWETLDALWTQVRGTGPWYLYEPPGAAPEAPLATNERDEATKVIDRHLRKQGAADLDLLAYADDPADPGLIKIYDPVLAGGACAVGEPAPPGWILSRSRPEPMAPKPAPTSGWRGLWQWRRGEQA